MVWDFKRFVTEKAGELGFVDAWYPIQVKQKDKIGRLNFA
jgi:hypothetical protein